MLSAGRHSSSSYTYNVLYTYGRVLRTQEPPRQPQVLSQLLSGLTASLRFLSGGRPPALTASLRFLARGGGGDRERAQAMQHAHAHVTCNNAFECERNRRRGACTLVRVESSQFRVCCLLRKWTPAAGRAPPLALAAALGLRPGAAASAGTRARGPLLVHGSRADVDGHRRSSVTWVSACVRVSTCQLVRAALQQTHTADLAEWRRAKWRPCSAASLRGSTT